MRFCAFSEDPGGILCIFGAQNPTRNFQKCTKSNEELPNMHKIPSGSSENAHNPMIGCVHILASSHEKKLMTCRLAEMSHRYRGHSINAFYHVSVHLAKQFQRRRFFKVGQSEKIIACGGHVPQAILISDWLISKKSSLLKLLSQVN
jgi:hypothetical protein